MPGVGQLLEALSGVGKRLTMVGAMVSGLEVLGVMESPAVEFRFDGHAGEAAAGHAMQKDIQSGGDRIRTPAGCPRRLLTQLVDVAENRQHLLIDHSPAQARTVEFGQQRCIALAAHRELHRSAQGGLYRFQGDLGMVLADGSGDHRELLFPLAIGQSTDDAIARLTQTPSRFEHAPGIRLDGRIPRSDDRCDGRL
jgi:hypothetical protein